VPQQQPLAPQYTTARDFSVNFNGTNEGAPPYYSLRRPKREFPVFEGNDVLKWIYKCNHYFDVEEVAGHDKLKLASYYLDGMVLCWHQNFMRSLGGQVVPWPEYVEALCCRFGEGKKSIRRTH